MAAERFPEMDLWIGINDKDEEGIWKYTSDGSEVTIDLWRDGEPSNDGNGEDCGAYSTVHGPLWNDLQCTRKLQLICEKPATRPSLPSYDYICEESGPSGTITLRLMAHDIF